jgi:hypothetical protein
VDGTPIKEPGLAGVRWRIHYNLQLPSLECDCFEITSARAAGTGEKLERLVIAPGDLILAGRGFCRPAGVAAVAQRDGALILRLHSFSLPLYHPGGQRLAILKQVRQLTQPGQLGEWDAQVRSVEGPITGRLCALRKNAQATAQAERRIVRKAQKNGQVARPATMELAGYVLVFTTAPASDFSAAQVLNLYRSRWQLELAFKRLKSLAQLGHLPKHDAEATRAWLYGKLLLVLLSQKLVRHGRDISPWGYPLNGFAAQPSMAAL